MVNSAMQPGIGTEVAAGYRKVFMTDKGALFLPAGRVIDGSESRDPLNTGYLTTLRPGLLMGEITSSGLYAPSVIGITGEAIESDETALTVTAAVVTELVRRVGSSGTFKVTGPATAGGTVRTLTATYSAASGTTITMTALGASSTWTLTETDGTDGGTFRLKVTYADGTSETTAAVAYNVSAADLKTALAALTGLTTDTVATSGEAAGPYTVTFDEDLGNVQLEAVVDLTADGGVYEGGITTAQTVTGVDGRFVTGSFIQPTDGSETIKTFISDGQGVKVQDSEGNDIDVTLAKIPVGGIVDASQLINYPADASLKAWVKAALRAVGAGFVFDDDF